MRLMFSLILALFLPGGSLMAAPQKVTTVEGITEYRLDNGLKVLLFPDPSNSTITVNVTYKVGSRHEGRGETGMAHLLEHMLFKGTHTIPTIWGALQEHGARFNGTTWLDRTNYFEWLPSTPENLDFALRMEADRMVNSRISGEELKTEMTVVRNEFEMGENDPEGILLQQMVSSAYLWHPYGHDTIGNRSDLERVPVENLRAFYTRYYQPDNAMLVVAGDFETEDALSLVEKYFGAIPRPTRTLTDTYSIEPEQDGPRHVELQRVGEVAAAGLVYHISAGSHPDYAPLELWANIMTDEPTGRLYRALVQSGKASSVYGFNMGAAEPGYFAAMASVKKGDNIQDVLEVMYRVAEGATTEVVTPEEVERARTRLLKDMEMALKDSASVAIQLSDWEAMGDWRLYFLHRDRLKQATTADVQRVATWYFRESNRTSGIFEPTALPERTLVPDKPDVQEMLKSYAGGQGLAAGEALPTDPEQIEARVERATLKNGLELVLLNKQSRGDSVKGQLTLRFGSEFDLAGQEFTQVLLGRMLMRGTRDLDQAALQQRLDQLKATLNVWSGTGSVTASFETDREHVVDTLALVGEILRHPALPAQDMEIVRAELLTLYEDQKADPNAQANNLIERALAPYNKDDVRYRPTVEEAITSLKRVSLAEIQKFHAEFYGAGDGELTLVGDFDSKAVKSAAKKSLGNWKSNHKYERITYTYQTGIASGLTVIQTPDKKMAFVGTATNIALRDDDPEYAALVMANYLLGGGSTARLRERLRQQEGFSYGAGSYLWASAHDTNGALRTYAICASVNAEKVRQVMMEEIDTFLKEGITQAELDRAKLAYALSTQNNLASENFLLGTLATNAYVGRTLTYQRDLWAHMQALTVDEVMAAARKHIRPERLVVVKAGDLPSP